jgi:hypothetical protein
MRYLSSKPFTGGANSKAFVDRWEETFGRKDASPEIAPPQGSPRADSPGEIERLKDLNRRLIDALYMLRWAVRDRVAWFRLTDREREVLDSAALLLAECGCASTPGTFHAYPVHTPH